MAYLAACCDMSIADAISNNKFAMGRQQNAIMAVQQSYYVQDSL